MRSLIPPPPLLCEVCSVLFYGRVDAKTCSKACKQKRRRRNIKESADET